MNKGIPIWHCTECHAEWAGQDVKVCYACKGEGEIIGHEKAWPDMFDLVETLTKELKHDKIEK